MNAFLYKVISLLWMHPIQSYLPLHLYKVISLLLMHLYTKLPPFNATCSKYDWKQTVQFQTR